MRENALAARGACLLDEAPEPSAMTGLADDPGQEVPRLPPARPPADQQSRYDRMFQYIRAATTTRVLAHEMGHSVGLRHNFVSSAAPLFYRPQYWQLRTNNGKVTSRLHRRRRRRLDLRRPALLGSGHGRGAVAD